MLSQCANAGASVFVHGGLLPRHVDEGLEKINKVGALSHPQQIGGRAVLSPDIAGDHGYGCGVNGGSLGSGDC